ncbi:MAG: hypothetical protein IPK58_14900 [Acidobacteria bacterium]|nr:hypothetical protein [Acidobacteriota bacterium]
MFFGGLVDELSIFNQTLNAAQISAIYDAGGSGVCRTCTQPPTGLISWWPGDGNPNDIRQGYNGTVHGNPMPYASGLVGNAFAFDGTDDFVSIPAIPEMNFGTGGFTVEFWMKSNNSSRRMNAVAFVPNYPISNLIFDFNDPDPPSPGLWVYWNSNGTKAIFAGTSGQYTNGQWHHIALTRIGTTLTLYIDGVAVGYETSSETFNLSSTTSYIGSGPGSAMWDGLVDELGIFGRGLEQAEIRAIYNAGNTGKCRPGLGKAYIPNGGDGTVSVIDIGTGTVDATITAPQQFGFVTIKNDGSKAYVSGAALSKVTVIDTATNEVLTDFTLPGATHGLAVDVTGTKLYVAQEFGNSLWVLNADTGALLATVPIGANPYGVAASPDGSRVYTANYSNGSVSMIRTSDLSVETFPTGNVPYGIAVTPDSSKVYVANSGSNTVSVIDTATNNITANISFPCPTGVGVNKSGTQAYVGSCSANNVLRINTSDNSTDLIPVGATTEGISVSPDGSRILAAARTGNAVLSINASTNTVTTIPVGNAPYSLGLFIAQGYTATPPATPDSCDPKPAGITHWWRGQGNALDMQKAFTRRPSITRHTLPASSEGVQLRRR